MMNILQFFKVTFVMSFLMFVTGCSDDDSPGTDVSASPADVIVINEGNFTSGDGTFATYNSTTQDVNLSVFAAANGFPIAATIQNAVVYNNNVYAVTNAPNKLDVFDLETFESVDYINGGFSNPYSFAAIGSKGYVTNWGAYDANYNLEGSFIAIIDLESYTITDSIDLEVQPQHVLAVGEYFYVSNVGGNTVSVYDPATDQEIEAIEVATGPDKMVLDANNDLWVICTSGNLVRIDIETNAVEATISGISGTGFNEKMVINIEGDKLYYLGTSPYPDPATYIYEVSIDATTAPAEALISGENFYGVGISPENELYVADAKAFQGNGSVFVYDLEGTEVTSFNVGRGPNGFIFK